MKASRARLLAAFVVLLAVVTTSCATSSPTTAPESAAQSSITTTTAVPAAQTDTPSTTSSAPTTTVITTPTTEPTASPAASQSVRTGAQVLVDERLDVLAGQRVGLIAHQNSVVGIDGDTQHLGDALHAAPEVELISLFGPEHGVRGLADAGELVADEVDEATGVPIFSLFGSTRQPTPEMLADLDVLIYDLQDVGTRYYTYISTMGLAMQAAAAAGVDFIVLDRPNPLGGTIAGGVLEAQRASFVGQYPLPDQYGLTSGELAPLIVDEQWLPGLESLDLQVVEMDGWTRDMIWEDTGLEWIPPSPAITTPDAALLYPTTIYLEASSISYGRGTETPFQVFGAPWLDADAAAGALNQQFSETLSFVATTISPAMLPGMTVAPAFLGETIPAVQIEVVDPRSIRQQDVMIALFDVLTDQANASGAELIARPDWLDQLAGNTTLRTAIQSGDFDPDLVGQRLGDQRSPALEDALQSALRY